MWPGLGGRGRRQISGEGVLTEHVVNTLLLFLSGRHGALAEHSGGLGPAPGPSGRLVDDGDGDEKSYLRLSSAE